MEANSCLVRGPRQDPGVLKIYIYKNCDSCRKALKWLETNGHSVETLPIRETPPSVTELKKVLSTYDGDLRRLFNTAGRDYREMDMKNRLPEMSEDEALKLLSLNGNLIKRPILVGNGAALAGFKVDEWEESVG